MSDVDGSSCGAVVVTVVHGRHDHLRRQREQLARCRPAPMCHVVVAMDDDGVAEVLGATPVLPTVMLTIPASAAGLPVAAARNAGARAALDVGGSEIVFLDVDCLPADGLVGGYVEALARRPGAIVCGPVTYLPPAPEGGWPVDELARLRAPHPARPDPPPGCFAPIGPALFWSLSFAVRPDLWRRLGGFFEGYLGYGGEDTDLGFTAADSGVDIVFVGGVDAYHQHHPTSDPPLEHLDDIVRNSAIFHRRHGALPMTGWLAQFREKGLVASVDGLPRRTDATRLLTVPAKHPYLDAALPTTVDRVSTDRVGAWEPDPMLVASAFAAAAGGIDVVHVHFGYEHLSPDEVARWLDALDRTGTPLVLTIHDLHNPHLHDQRRHLEQLRQLASCATRVPTLTAGAAERCAELLGRRPEVVAHPTLLDETPAPAAGRDHVLVPLKALRANIVDAVQVVRSVADAASSAGRPTRVWLDPSAAGHPDFDRVVELGEREDVDLALKGHVPHAEVVDEVASAHAVVLPYRFGTHSGWVELARDVGTAVVVPDTGAYSDQWKAVHPFHVGAAGPDPASLVAAISAACAENPAPADRGRRLAQRDVVRATHEAIYRAVRRD